MKQESSDIELNTVKDYAGHESDNINDQLIEQHNRWNTIVLKFKIFWMFAPLKA